MNRAFRSELKNKKKQLKVVLVFMWSLGSTRNSTSEETNWCADDKIKYGYTLFTKKINNSSNMSNVLSHVSSRVLNRGNIAPALPWIGYPVARFWRNQGRAAIKTMTKFGYCLAVVFGQSSIKPIILESVDAIDFNLTNPLLIKKLLRKWVHRLWWCRKSPSYISDWLPLRHWKQYWKQGSIDVTAGNCYITFTVSFRAT